MECEMSVLNFFRWPASALLGVLAVIAVVTSATASPGPLVEVEWLKRNLDRDDVIILDTRAANGDGNPYAEGHIPGALHAPYPGGWRTTRDGVPGQLPELHELEVHISALGITGGETVVIVPAASDASEFGGATRIYWTLKLVGLDNIAILNGGYRAWNADPETTLSTEPHAPRRASFTAELREDLLISSDEVRQRLDNGSTVMLDGRPEAQFAGKEKHPVARLFGRLPGATHLDHSVFFEPETGRLLPEEAAATLIPSNVTDPDLEIVSYCNTGHWASVNWFVLSEVLGYSKVTLFDDSMVGWAEDPNNPIESDRSRLDDLRDWWNRITG
jgi:thiosulfate/3-mercaptopyruvate sulfurtransferase